MKAGLASGIAEEKIAAIEKGILHACRGRPGALKTVGTELEGETAPALWQVGN